MAFNASEQVRVPAKVIQSGKAVEFFPEWDT